MQPSTFNNDGMIYHAGFPNAAEDTTDISLNLDKLLVKHRASTYYWRLSDPLPVETGWGAGDVAVVDRLVQPQTGDWVVIVYDGTFGLRKYEHVGNRTRLWKEGDERQDVDSSITIWGVVTYVVVRARGK